MMPLWLFTLGRTFYGEKLLFPWMNIAGSLVVFVLPIGLGMLFAWRKQHLVERIRPVITWFAIMMMIFVIVFYSYANW